MTKPLPPLRPTKGQGRRGMGRRAERGSRPFKVQRTQAAPRLQEEQGREEARPQGHHAPAAPRPREEQGQEEESRPQEEHAQAQIIHGNRMFGRQGPGGM